MKRRIAVLSVVVILLFCASVPSRAADCETLSAVKLADTTITVAQPVAAGAFTLPPGPPNPFNMMAMAAFKAMPAFCRVAGTIKPTTDSNILFEVWMPASGWNGKIQGVGNGGFAGDMPYYSFALPLSRGYAVTATDTGHTGGADAKWALGHPEKLTDYGYRAVHETAVRARAIVNAFYGAEPQHAYFSSCSNGGRQALMEAQRFPNDYDGIIAGAPANFFSHHMSGFAWDMQALSAPDAYIPPTKLKAIEAAALAACDARDGLKDGVIDDPRKCRFDPSVLLCKGPESDECLTQPQVTALRKIYAGAHNSRGQSIFPAFVPGGETGLLGWQTWFTGTAPGKSEQTRFAEQYFANMVYGVPSWDVKSFNPDRDVKAADDKTAHELNAMDPNLKAYHGRGGKLILYHGWADAAIPPENTINYYDSVVSNMGQNETAQFVRLFMAPGMQHCFFGPGPNSFGQFLPAMKSDPQHDISVALEQWVEKGIAPDSLVAVKFKSDINPASGVDRTRPLCAYPKVARWTGNGSMDDAANFVCTSDAGATPKSGSISN